MSAAWEAERLVAEVERFALRGLPVEEFQRELAARIRRRIPIDAACWHGLDPRTLLLTTANPEELLAGGYLTAETEPLAARAVLASEYQREDYNSFATLARRRAPVGILTESTRGRPERSARYREFLAVRGTPYELRSAFVTRGRAWGCAVFHRSEGLGDFTRTEARLVARLCRPIAEGIRASVRLDAARRADDATVPGMVVLGPRNELELVTPAAQRLLDLLRGSSAGLPAPVIALAARVRQLRAEYLADAATSLQVSSPVGVLSLHAALPDGTATGRVAMVIQPASVSEAVPLRLEAHGLSSRERDVATLVAEGHDTATIAARLFLSPWTVQDHLKSIFEKTGTRSRRELRGRIFFDEYLPAIARRTPLQADGGVVPPEPAAVKG